MPEYLNNKALLREIHNSKATFSFYLSPEHSTYHTIVGSANDITPALAQLISEDLAQPKGRKPPVSVAPENVVFRVMTHEHIPLDPDRKRKARNTDQSYARTNFPPFKHYVFQNGAAKEVGRSHWRDSLVDGSFSQTHGRINNQLAKMFMLLADRLSSRYNWRGYSYVDDMKSEALATLCQNGLLFDESKGDNPFAFYTTVINNSFLRILNKEKRTHIIRDDLLEIVGATPSMTRQLEHELRHMHVPEPVRKDK